MPPSCTMGTLSAEPGTGRTISPLVAARLCVQPRAVLTAHQVARIDTLKTASPEFAVMRSFAMCFRGLLRSGSKKKLDRRINDAFQSGIYAMQRFVRTVQQDYDAVKQAFTRRWSNGPTEGQVNRLKMRKRALYGRAGVELLRARMLPLHPL